MLKDDTVLHATIFNRKWMNKIPLNTVLTLFAKYEGNQRITVISYNTTPLNQQLGLNPVYHLKEGIQQKTLVSMLKKVIPVTPSENIIPEQFRIQYRLLDKNIAIQQIHFPQNQKLLHEAQRTLKYEEFLKFEWIISQRKQMNHVENLLYKKEFDTDTVFHLINRLPFNLTKDQHKAIVDILDDLQQPKMMYRLVQGDVGCGKTIVAIMALYANSLANRQGAFMVPTEILAQQQYEEVKKVLQNTSIRVCCLYSSLSAEEKRNTLEKIKNHEVDIVVGTHALFQQQVQFSDLGLMVTDEQHRFGVEQRRKLREKGQYVDVLVMSATPIPRTLATVLYGDMDVTLIESQPEGRKPVITRWIHENSMNRILDEILKRIDQGERCYVVCSAIEQDTESQIRNVYSITEALQNKLNDRYQIASLHGKMGNDEKTQIMEDFKSGKVQILVSTTVVEVGVSVKEASMMVIYNAERFGLSQLHQLRGRVKRSSHQGYCYLLSNQKDEDAKQRLEALCHHENGFDIADIDLQLRGPGDLLGQRQSGIPVFRIGNILTDQNIINTAKKDVQYLIEHPEIDKEELEKVCMPYIQDKITLD